MNYAPYCDMNAEINPRWNKCIEDVRLAQNAIKSQMLERDDSKLICDYYTVPAHNHYCFYARIYQPDWTITYARTEIDDIHSGTVIKMYPFSDALAAEDHTANRGRIICGERKLDSSVAEAVEHICAVLPDELMPEEHHGLVLDGVTQMMRVYKDGSVVKNALWLDGDHMNHSAEMEELYLLLEGQIRT